MEQNPVGLTMEETSRLLHIGVEQLREYARTDPTFPCFSVGNKLITTKAAISEWATARAKMRVGMKTEGSAVMEIVRRNRRFFACQTSFLKSSFSVAISPQIVHRVSPGLTSLRYSTIFVSMRVGMKTEGSAVMEIVRRNRRRA